MAMRHHAEGPSLPVVTACATSTNAIGEAYRAIKHGYAAVFAHQRTYAADTAAHIYAETVRLDFALYAAVDKNGAALLYRPLRIFWRRLL